MATLPQMKSFLTRASKKSDASDGLKRIANALKNFRQLAKEDQKDLNDLVRSAYGKLKSKPKATKTATPKKATPKKTDSFSTDLAKFKKKVGKVIYRRATSGTDIIKDAQRPALKSGKRIVRKQGYTSNQYGTFENKVGTPYWESRSNRMDVNQPSQRARVKLADGGEVYGVEKFWNELSSKEKMEWLKKRRDIPTDYKSSLSRDSYEKLPDWIKLKVKKAYNDNKIYKFAKGGEVGKSYTFDNEGYSYTNNFGVDQADFIKLVDVYHTTNPSNQTDRIVERLTYRSFEFKYGQDKLDEVMNYIHETHESHERGYAKGGEVEDELIEYTIPTWALPSLINADDSGLNDEDIKKLNNFVDEVVKTYGNAYFMLGDNWEESEFSRYNDIDNLASNVVTLYIKPSKKLAKGGKLSSRARYIPNRNIQEVEITEKGKTRFIDGANVLDGIYEKKKKLARGGEVDKQGMIYALSEHISSGEIANRTDVLDYDTISKIRTKAIEYYLENGDKPYSFNEMDRILKEMASSDEISRMRHFQTRKMLRSNENTYPKGTEFADGGELEDAKIYVADLSEYNNGRLVGKWLNLSDYSSGAEVMEAIQEMLDEQTKKDKYGEVHEEYAIHDFEGFPRSFYSEYMGEGDFDNLYEIMRIADSSNLPVDVLMEAMSDLGYEDNAERVAEAYYSSVPASMGNEFRDFAYEYIDSIGGITDAVSNPEYYFDYESFGSDVRMDYTEEELEEMGYDELNNAELGEQVADEQGGVENLGEKTIEMYFDYDKFARELEYDFIAVRGKDGDYYFFNRNFAKGGKVDKKKYNFTILEYKDADAVLNDELSDGDDFYGTKERAIELQEQRMQRGYCIYFTISNGEGWYYESEDLDELKESLENSDEDDFIDDDEYAKGGEVEVTADEKKKSLRGNTKLNF